MDIIWKSFASLADLIAAIDVSTPAPRPNIVSTRNGLKSFLQRFREGPECTRGMYYALSDAIKSLSDGPDPERLEDCMGRPGFGADPSKPVLRLVRKYFEEEHNLDIGILGVEDAGADDGNNNPNGFWKVCKAPSNRSTCVKCKSKIEAGDLRIELGGAQAIVSNQAGRPITDFKHATCFFEWLGSGRRVSTKGLGALNDLTGFAEMNGADQERFRGLFRDARARFQQRHAASLGRARDGAAATPRASGAGAAAVPPSPGRRPRQARELICSGSVRSLLRMCPREQLGDDLRRAVRDVVRDENFDDSAAPAHRLDFEILVLSPPPGAMRKAFLIERKSFSDLFASQRGEAGPAPSRLDSQLARLRDAVEYEGRLMIVEAPDNDWKHDRTAEGYSDLIGVQTKLQLLQCEFGQLQANGIPAVRVIRVRSPVETAQAICQLMREALDIGRPRPAAAPTAPPASPAGSPRTPRAKRPRVSDAAANSPASSSRAVPGLPLDSPAASLAKRKSSGSLAPDVASPTASSPVGTPISAIERERRRNLAATQAEKRQTKPANTAMAQAAAGRLQNSSTASAPIVVIDDATDVVLNQAPTSAGSSIALPFKPPQTKPPDETKEPVKSWRRLSNSSPSAPIDLE